MIQEWKADEEKEEATRNRVAQEAKEESDDRMKKSEVKENIIIWIENNKCVYILNNVLLNSTQYFFSGNDVEQVN